MSIRHSDFVWHTSPSLSYGDEPSCPGNLSHLSSSFLRISSSPSGLGGGLGGRSFAKADSGDGVSFFRAAEAATTGCCCLDPNVSFSFVASTITTAAEIAAAVGCDLSLADRIAAAAAAAAAADELEPWFGGETEGRGREVSHPDPRAAAYCGIRLRRVAAVLTAWAAVYQEYRSRVQMLYLFSCFLG